MIAQRGVSFQRNGLIGMIRHVKLKETAAASILRSDDTIFLTISSSAMISKPGKEAQFVMPVTENGSVIDALLTKQYLSCTSLVLDIPANCAYSVDKYLTNGCYPFMTTMTLNRRNDGSAVTCSGKDDNAGRADKHPSL